MISVIGGEPGNGKGVFAMSVIEQACLAGRPVYTNIGLTVKCPFYDRVVEIDTADDPVYRGSPGGVAGSGKVVKASDDYRAFWHYALPGAVVIIDEADLYFDCTDHSVVGRDFRAFLKQHRKLGMDTIFHRPIDSESICACTSVGSAFHCL